MTIEELQQLREGSLHLDCPRIRLIGTKQGQSHEMIGPGYIRQIPGRGFGITVFISSPLEFRSIAESFCDSFSQDQAQAGMLYSKEVMYSLEAVDVAGRQWRAEDILPPQSSGYVGHPAGYVVNADCHKIILVKRERGSNIPPRYI